MAATGAASRGLAQAAAKRLFHEYRELSQSDAIEGIVAGPVSDEDPFVWEALVLGPPGSFYEGACFRASLRFPPDYPLSPPTLRFVSEVFHPNVFPDGAVCISILHKEADATNAFELPSERWSPAQSVEKILLSVMSMLAEPNDQSPAHVDAAKLWREDRRAFAAACLRCVRKSLAGAA